MKHVKALAVKGIMTLVFLYVILGFGFGLSFWDVFVITIILGGITYWLGDILILPKITNIMATVADLGVAFFLIWLLGIALAPIAPGTMAGAAAISAIAIAVGEYFFHIYLAKLGIGSDRLSTSSS
ncbi:hypothetical protein J26TS2_26060 [Shouchella clausii]|uniref:DUF2512 family protein n=1 Tax=Shouchella tritolerans TaxID=2979466 RepID=UPI0007882B93|nr:DUF2512 family protein [Shouchella tritolerans]GIN12739.1 hypothetical protein J26TS2_26060 [Shouchella clausii]